jgi:hypothetical protein
MLKNKSSHLSKYYRKDVNSIGWSIKSLTERYECLREDIINFVSIEDYEKTVELFKKLKKNIKEALDIMPIGYEYSGVFYLKIPLVTPAKFEKYEGKLFMREDLICWRITEGKIIHHYKNYYRYAFKQPNEKDLITRADAKPVFKLP